MVSGSYAELIAFAREALAPLCLLSESLEARELVAYAARLQGAIIKAGELYPPRTDAQAPLGAREKLEELLVRRLREEPLAYIIGEWDFRGITLYTPRGVLIPRADTEAAVAFCVERTEEPKRIFDLCCGTGCIGIALLREFEDAYCVFGDIDTAATECTKSNIARHSLERRSEVCEIDAFEPYPFEKNSFDLVVSNPPYVTALEMNTLPVSVAAFEPYDALYGGTDGLNYFRSIAENAQACLRAGGSLVFECGAEQSRDVARILISSGYGDIDIIKDLNGAERVVGCKKRG